MTELNKTPREGKFKSRVTLARKILELLESEVASFVADSDKTPRILYIPELAYRAALGMSKDSDTAHAIVKRFCTGYRSRLLPYESVDDLEEAFLSRGQNVGLSYDVGSTYVARSRLHGVIYHNLSISTIIIYATPEQVSPNLIIQADNLSSDEDEDDDDVDEEEGKRPYKTRNPKKVRTLKTQVYPYCYADAANTNWRVVDDGSGTMVLKTSPFRVNTDSLLTLISISSRVDSGALSLTINGQEVNVEGYKPSIDSIKSLLFTTHVLDNEEEVLPVNLQKERLPKTAIQKFVNLANGLTHTGKTINK